MAVEDFVAQDQLRAFIERIERMEEEKAAIAADIKEIYAEAKGNGFDTKILRKIVTIRKQDANERMEQEALLEMYMDALGMVHAHEDALDRALRRNSAAHSAPLSAGRVETISEPQPTKAAGQAGAEAADVSGHSEPRVGTSSVENEAAEISTPIQPETANEKPETSEFAAADPQRSAVAVRKGAKSEVSGEPKYAAPGVVTTEHTPPEPVKWHSYAQCFPTVLGDDLKALEADIHTAFGGVRDPIVKIGNLILDGRARYGITRSMMIDYPVVQYAGSDPLIDVIAWNLASRQDRMTPGQIAATAKALCKVEPSRADDIMQAFGLEVSEAAQ